MGEKLSFAPAENQEQEEQEKVAKILAKLQAHLHGNKDVYQTLTGRNFKFRFGEHTAFDHRKREVIVGVDDVMSLGVMNEQGDLNDHTLDFLMYHELGHYRELYADPQGYLDLIESIKTKEHGPAIFQLYNCLMDIYANRATANSTPRYRGKGKEAFSPEVKDLYTQKAFNRESIGEKIKQKQMGWADQFATYLLNEGMEVGDDYYQCLDERVKQVIDQGIKDNGSTISYHDFINRRLSPILDGKKAYQASIGERQKLIDRNLLPIYLQLLEEDRQQQRQQQQEGQGGSGQSQPGEGQAGEGQAQPSAAQSEQAQEDARAGQDGGDDWNTPEGKSALDALNRLKEILTKDALPKKNEESMSEQEKAKKRGQEAIADGLQKALDQLQETDDDELKELINKAQDLMSEARLQQESIDFQQRLERMRPIIEKLEQLWERICHETVIQKWETQGYFKTGTGVSIPRVIRQFSTILTKPENATVMEKNILHEIKDRMPKKFHLNLMLDISGSMSGNVENLRDFFIALASSLERFNSHNLDRYYKQELAEPIEGLLDIYFFNDGVFHVVKGDRATRLEDIMGAYYLLNADNGNWSNPEVRVLNDIRTRNDIASNSGRLKEDAIEISVTVTDGVYDNTHPSTDAVGEMLEMGVITGGIFLGHDAPQDFHDIFPPGISLNTPDASGLPEVMEQLLEKVLQPPDDSANGTKLFSELVS